MEWLIEKIEIITHYVNEKGEEETYYVYKLTWEGNGMLVTDYVGKEEYDLYRLGEERE